MLGRQRETDVNRKRSRSRKDPWEAENEKQEKESKGEGQGTSRRRTKNRRRATWRAGGGVQSSRPAGLQLPPANRSPRPLRWGVATGGPVACPRGDLLPGLD